MICDLYELGISEEKARALEIELRKLLDTDDFVLGTFNDLETEEDAETLLNFILENKDKLTRTELYEEVFLLSMELNEEYCRKNGITHEWDPD